MIGPFRAPFVVVWGAHAAGVSVSAASQNVSFPGAVVMTTWQWRPRYREVLIPPLQRSRLNPSTIQSHSRERVSLQKRDCLFYFHQILTDHDEIAFLSFSWITVRNTAIGFVV